MFKTRGVTDETETQCVLGRRALKLLLQLRKQVVETFVLDMLLVSHSKTDNELFTAEPAHSQHSSRIYRERKKVYAPRRVTGDRARGYRNPTGKFSS